MATSRSDVLKAMRDGARVNATEHGWPKCPNDRQDCDWVQGNSSARKAGYATTWTCRICKDTRVQTWRHNHKPEWSE
jgi:hypothetical protein